MQDFSFKMQLVTFYAHIGRRGAKIPIITLDHFPTDWYEMRMRLAEAMKKAYEDYGIIEAQWTLERHVPTKFKVWRPRPGSYIPKPFSKKRTFEAYFIAAYDPLSDTVEVKQAVFAPYHMDIATDYMAIEKDIKFRLPPIVPKTFKSLIENPQSMFEELSAIRYPDYSTTPKLRYDKQTEKPNLTHLRTYLPWGEKMKERTG
jgi:hypothetical protein